MYFPKKARGGGGLLYIAPNSQAQKQPDWQTTQHNINNGSLMNALGSFVFPSSSLFTNTANATLGGPVSSPHHPREAHFTSDGWICDGVMWFIFAASHQTFNANKQKTEALGTVGRTEAANLRVTAADPNRHFADWVNVPTLFFLMICEIPLNNPNHTVFRHRKIDKQLGQGTVLAVDLFVRQCCRPSLVSNRRGGAFVLRLSSRLGWLDWYCAVKAPQRNKKNSSFLCVWTTEDLFLELASRELWDPVYWNPVCEPCNASKNIEEIHNLTSFGLLFSLNAMLNAV